jgi:hypothetical protein
MIRRKLPGNDKKSDEPRLGPVPKKLHRNVHVSSLPDGVVLNANQDGFRLDAKQGDRLVVLKHYGTVREPLVCEVLKVEIDEADQGYGLVETWNETEGCCFCFTPMEAALKPDLLTVKLLAGARTVLG